MILISNYPTHHLLLLPCLELVKSGNIFLETVRLYRASRGPLDAKHMVVGPHTPSLRGDPQCQNAKKNVLRIVINKCVSSIHMYFPIAENALVDVV